MAVAAGAGQLLFEQRGRGGVPWSRWPAAAGLEPWATWLPPKRSARQTWDRVGPPPVATSREGLCWQFRRPGQVIQMQPTAGRAAGVDPRTGKQVQRGAESTGGARGILEEADPGGEGSRE